MSLEQSGKWCKYCQRYVLITRHRIGGCAIVLGSVLSLGLLLPFIVLYMVGPFGWRCNKCGRVV